MQIMYGANLSYKVLSKYLEDVIKACLIRFESEENCYVITAKGWEFLEKYSECSRRNRHVERQLNDVESKRRVLRSYVRGLN